MPGTLRIEAVLLALFLVGGAASARAQDAPTTHVYACADSVGSVRLVDAPVACNPGQRRYALAVAGGDDGIGELGRGLLLLLATAITSGLLVPYVLGRVDHRRSQHESERQTRLARESKVIEAQARLLDSLSRVLWRWRYLVMRVTYYGNRSEDPRYKAACHDYDTAVWGVLNRFRVEVSRSQRLASQNVHAMLQDFYRLMVDIDNRIRDIQQSSEDTVKLAIAYSDLNHEVFEDVTARIDDMLSRAAREMGLTGATAATR